MPPKKSTIFISYVRKDSDFALKLGQDLRSAGADIWLDTLDIIASQRWDDAIQEALKACDSFLIILSPKSVVSDNVKDELSFALEQNKQIIPVLHKNCEIPFRVSRIQYSDFTQDYDVGFSQLINAINLQQPADTPEQTKPEKEKVEKPKKPVSDVQKTVPSAEKIKKPKLAEAKAKPGQKKQVSLSVTQTKSKFKRKFIWGALVSITLLLISISVIQMIDEENGQSIKTTPATQKLRNKPRELSEEAAKELCKNEVFFEQKWNVTAVGIQHTYESKSMNGEKVIVDSSTMLVWQQSGFAASTFDDAEDKILKLNDKSSGIKWRLPTLEEAMSLMEPKKAKSLHINPIFNPEANQIWTSDYGGSHAWVISFETGRCTKKAKGYRDDTGVLAVRSSDSIARK